FNLVVFTISQWDLVLQLSGCSWSNMGGVEGTLDDGLTKFKDNFNPTINEFIGEFDIPVYPFMYRLTQKAYKILKSKHM
ncbi:peptidoglycan bridge formation glycyltransferase FemA/FemB family protein, partial [Holdemanella biformis]